MGYDGEKDGIPRVIKDSIQYLRETGTSSPVFLVCCAVMIDGLVGLEEEGLFRRSPNLTLLNQVAGAYDRGEGVGLDRVIDRLTLFQATSCR